MARTASVAKTLRNVALPRLVLAAIKRKRREAAKAAKEIKKKERKEKKERAAAAKAEKAENKKKKKAQPEIILESQNHFEVFKGFVRV